MAAALLYSGFLLMLRQSTVAADGTPGAVAAPLFESTLGAAVAAVVSGFALHDFRLGHPWPALGWLVVLALTSQRPSMEQLGGVALILAGVVIAVPGRRRPDGATAVAGAGPAEALPLPVEAGPGS